MRTRDITTIRWDRLKCNHIIIFSVFFPPSLFLFSLYNVPLSGFILFFKRHLYLPSICADISALSQLCQFISFPILSECTHISAVCLFRPTPKMFRILFTFSVSSSVVFLFMYLYLSLFYILLKKSLPPLISQSLHRHHHTSGTDDDLDSFRTSRSKQNKENNDFFYFSPRPGDV